MVEQEQNDLEKAKKSFFKNPDKIYTEQSKTFWHLSNQTFSCQKDAEESVLKFSKQLNYHEIHYEVLPVYKHANRGRPGQHSQAQCIGYRCQGSLATNLEKVRAKIERLGRFILATNELDSSVMSYQEILLQYKSQTQIELGFKFLKSDEFDLNHVFLKNPNRIGALMMLMTLCLVVYNFAQYQLRQALEHKDTVVPNQLGKPIKNPTLRWMFQLMSSITVLCLWDNEHERWVKKICNLKKVHRVILHHFGSQVLKVYGLPPGMELPEYDKNTKSLIQWCEM